MNMVDRRPIKVCFAFYTIVFTSGQETHQGGCYLVVTMVLMSGVYYGKAIAGSAEWIGNPSRFVPVMA